MMERPMALAEPMLLAFTGVAALVLAAAWQWGGAEWLLLFAAPLWLTPLAVYDLRHRQVPHLAWVSGPCLLAMGLAAARGDWALAGIALVALAAGGAVYLVAVVGLRAFNAEERATLLGILPAGLRRRLGRPETPSA